MSNSVAKFLSVSSSSAYNSHLIIATSSKVNCNLSFCGLVTSSANLIVSLPDSKPGEFNSVELTKDEITVLLTLECPDDFIAYALTLCPCPPETSADSTANANANVSASEVDGGILTSEQICSSLSSAVDFISSVSLGTKSNEAFELIESLTALITNIDPSYIDANTMSNCPDCGVSVTDYELEICTGRCSQCLTESTSNDYPVNGSYMPSNLE